LGVPRFEIILSKKFICGAALSVPIFLPEEAGQKGFSLQSLTLRTNNNKKLIHKKTR
jgi:hypothetical protein